MDRIKAISLVLIVPPLLDALGEEDAPLIS
jgi:hypothetical protein